MDDILNGFGLKELYAGICLGGGASLAGAALVETYDSLPMQTGSLPLEYQYGIFATVFLGLGALLIGLRVFEIRTKRKQNPSIGGD